MQLEDMGNAVKIGDTIIPAVNIQVEGFPRWDEAHQYFYGIYFEIVFEDGSLWELNQMQEGMPIELLEYPLWAWGSSYKFETDFPNWEEIARFYKIKNDVNRESASDHMKELLQ